MSIRLITAIMACAPNGGISFQEHLPWELPEDQFFFREMTKNKLIIVGYKTYLQMSVEMLMNCCWVVFSRDKTRERRSECNHKVIFVNGMDDFLLTDPFNEYNECYMIGGAEIARLFLKYNMIDQFFLTQVNNQYETDRFIPLDFTKMWPKKCVFQDKECSFNYYLNPLSHIVSIINGATYEGLRKDTNRDTE